MARDNKDEKEEQGSTGSKKGYVKEKIEDPLPVKRSGKPQKGNDGNGVVIMLAVLCAILLVVFVCLAFNFGGFRTKVIAFLTNPKDGIVIDATLKERLTAQVSTIEEQKKILDEERARLNDMAEQQKAREEQYKKLEQEVAQLKATPTPKAVAKAGASPSPSAGVDNTTKIYESMDSSSAAAIIQAMDTLERKVAVLKKLKKQTAADILAEMPAKDSAEIMKALAK